MVKPYKGHAFIPVIPIFNQIKGIIKRLALFKTVSNLIHHAVS